MKHCGEVRRSWPFKSPSTTKETHYFTVVILRINTKLYSIFAGFLVYSSPMKGRQICNKRLSICWELEEARRDGSEEPVPGCSLHTSFSST